jgi:indole-3-glycerol phosphate synthase
MPIYLSEIVTRKRQRLEERGLNYDDLAKRIEFSKARPNFKDALQQDGLSIIGEIKKASPSKGLIREDFHPLDLAKAYEESVDAISVLTEESYFLGSDIYLEEVSQNVNLPTLCKDFIIDPMQIMNAKALGASAVLLIVNILTDTELKNFMRLAKDLGMDALVETHTREEIDRAVLAGAEIIGINNRNLTTFDTSIDVTLELAKYVPDECVLISESGILSPLEVEVLSYVNIDGILVGESFMRSPSIQKSAKEFKNAYRR